MVAFGIQPIEINIDHVGEPSQRMPIGRLCACKSPNSAFSSQACLNMAIFCDVQWVVIVDKIMVLNLPEEHKGDQSKNSAHPIKMTCTLRVVRWGGGEMWRQRTFFQLFLAMMLLFTQILSLPKIDLKTLFLMGNLVGK